MPNGAISITITGSSNGSGNRGVNFQKKIHYETLYHLPFMPGFFFFSSTAFN
jgi:hypothetical protein